MKNSLFTLRKDQNNFRPVFLLGNERGSCLYNCRFCSSKTLRKVSSTDNIKRFDELFDYYLSIIDGPYHPLIYNDGNCTNQEELSEETLNYVLKAFDRDPRVLFVSINSREGCATPEILNNLAGKHLSYPIHFILGVESFSPNIHEILGKNNHGELDRFISKLQPYNLRPLTEQPQRGYTFGLDVNLVFLPELYLKDGEKRKDNKAKIKEGIKKELRQLLFRIVPHVPVEINIHPYHTVDALPYQKADLDQFMRILPELQEMILTFNRKFKDRQAHLFIGVQGTGYNSKQYIKQIRYWSPIIDEFNRTGRNFSDLCNQMLAIGY